MNRPKNQHFFITRKYFDELENQIKKTPDITLDPQKMET